MLVYCNPFQLPFSFQSGSNLARTLAIKWELGLSILDDYRLFLFVPHQHHVDQLA